MRKQDYLPELIRSLTPSEKRYFKLYTSIQPGAKNYLRLYELLEKDSSYETVVICKKLKITPKKLADEKEYLQMVLLKVLRNFEEDVNPKVNFTHRYLEAEMLAKRGMREYALSHLDKTYEKAIQHEQYGVFVESFQLRHSLVQNRPDPSPELVSREVYKKQIDRLNELVELKMLYGDLIPHLVQTHDRASALKINKHPLMQKKPEDLLSIQAEIMWHNTKTHLIAHTEGSDSNAALHAYKIIDAFEKNPVLKQIMPDFYVRIFMQIADCLPTDRLEEGLKMIDRAISIIDSGQLPLYYKTAEQLRYNALAQKGLILYILYRYKESIAISDEIMDFELPVPRQYLRITFLYIYASALLFSGQAEKALLPLREILQGNKSVRVDIQLYAMLLELMVQYDLKNYSLIPYMAKSIRKWILRKKLAPDESDLFIKWMLRISSESLAGKKKDELKAFLADVNENKIKIEIADHIKYWLEGKL